MGGHAPPPVPFVLTTATFAFLFLERTEASVPLSSFMVPGSLASLRRSQSGTEVRVSCPQTGAHPSPTAARPALPRSGRATHLSLLSLGMAQGVGSNLRPGEHRAGDGVRTAGQGDQGPPARPGHPSPSRAGGGGSLPGRSGKWPMGPGWHVTRGAASSPRYRVRTRGGGAARHPETPAGPSLPSAPGLPRSPPQHLL